MLDNDVINYFRSRAEEEGLGYQRLINKVLKEHSNSSALNEETLRKIIREELKSA